MAAEEASKAGTSATTERSPTSLAAALIAAQRVLSCLTGLQPYVLEAQHAGNWGCKGRTHLARAVGELSFRRAELRAALTPCAWELAGIQGPQGITWGEFCSPSAHALIDAWAEGADEMSEWLLGEELHAAARERYGLLRQSMPNLEQQRAQDGRATPLKARMKARALRRRAGRLRARRLARCEKAILKLAAQPADGFEVFHTEMTKLLGRPGNPRKLWVALECEYAIAQRRREDRREHDDAEPSAPASSESLEGTSARSLRLVMLAASQLNEQFPGRAIKLDSLAAKCRKIAELAPSGRKTIGRTTVWDALRKAKDLDLLDEELRLTQPGQRWLDVSGESGTA